MSETEYMSAYTVTLGDCAENEVGMAVIGESAPYGLSVEHLDNHCIWSRDKGWDTDVYNLHQILPSHERLHECAAPATLLVLRNGVDRLLGDGGEKKLFHELESMPKDTTTYMYGRVVNKHARHNNCLATHEQAPDIANKMGTVVNFTEHYWTNSLFEEIQHHFDIVHPLVGELNHYYDADKCYIGFHGDKERKIVVGVRSGPGADGFPLKFQWYRNHEPVGDTGYLPLNRGDIYLMSEKAVGTDWHETKHGLLTLRHAAGKKSALKKRKRDDKDPKSVRLCPNV